MTYSSAHYAQVRLHGEYDIARQEELRSSSEPAADAPVAILNNMRDVTYPDASPLTQLIKLKRRMLNRPSSG